MDNIVMDVSCIIVYIDSMLVFFEFEEQQYKDFRKGLSILEKNNLQISVDKCQFYLDTINFWGYNVSTGGLKPTTQNVEYIKIFQNPKMPNPSVDSWKWQFFYRKLIPQAPDLLQPLKEAIKHNLTAKTLELSPAEEHAFVTVKDILAKISALTYTDPDATQYHLVTDISNYAVGVALHHIINWDPVPIGFYSKKLSEKQRKYSPFDRELLAAYQAVLHFKPQTEGRHVVTPILSYGVNCNAISGQGVHVTPYTNSTAPTSSTRQAIGPIWSSITG